MAEPETMRNAREPTAAQANPPDKAGVPGT